jgi:ATP-dependent RNA helicase DeaD
MSGATSSFATLGLRPTTLSALDHMEIETPTPIQAAALPALLAGRDVIGQARTGSGKTLAFGIPAAELVDPKRRAVQVLVLVPTRELAVQVGAVLDAVGAARGVTTTLIFGGRAAGPQVAALRRGAHIVVGTPGRVLDLLNQGALQLANVRFLVLDEADEMLDRGFALDVERILARTPRGRQTALFSATVPDWVAETADKHLLDPLTVRVDPNPEDAAPIDHIAWEVADGDKLSALRDLLDQRGDGSIIVFGRTKHGVKKLARRLELDGYPVAALQGNLSQNARDRVMEDFRAGRVQILLATNVAARGLDISSVDLVINVELPETPELLTHRVGRTGRMGRKGQAITLLGPEDAAKWRQLERGLSRRIPRAAWQGAAFALAATPESVTLPTPRREQPRPGRRSEPAPAAAPRTLTRVIGPSAGYTPPRHGVRPASASANPGHEGATRASVARGQTERPRGVQRSRRTQRAEHAITCSGCGRNASVPFQPDLSRPVYCASCFTPRRGR